MLKVRLYREGRIEEEGFDPARVSDLIGDPENLVWLDLEEPTDTELSLIEEEFSFHPLAMEDARHRNQRPKLEPYEGFYFLVAYGLTMDGGGLTTSEIHAFVGTGYLVTLRYAPAYDLSRVLKRWERQPAMTREGGGWLLYALLDDVVDGYFTVVDAFQDATEGVEEGVFQESPSEQKELQEEIFRLKKQVIEFRRLVAPLREVLAVLQQDPRLVTDALRAYYRDVQDHVVRTQEFIDNVRELLTTALEAYLSQVGNRLNIIMKQVTSWAAILLVPTLIAGIYGMNFRFMPELDWRLGYPMALGMMAVAGFLLFRLFRKRDWL